MELASGSSPVPRADADLVFFPASDDARGRSVRPQSRSLETVGRNGANRVLILGRLRELALYRAEVLRNYGFQVLIPETDKEAIEIIDDRNFDVAVLSYTLLDTEVQDFVERIRQSCPDCPVLAIAQTTKRDRRIEPDAVVLAENGPTELVAALRTLLRQR
jgi:DNA-binding response OmpR family regulator